MNVNISHLNKKINKIIFATHGIGFTLLPFVVSLGSALGKFGFLPLILNIDVLLCMQSLLCAIYWNFDDMF